MVHAPTAQNEAAPSGFRDEARRRQRTSPQCGFRGPSSAGSRARWGTSPCIRVRLSRGPGVPWHCIPGSALRRCPRRLSACGKRSTRCAEGCPNGNRGDKGHSVSSLLALRAVLVTGKGGVGKTTVAASLARWVAQSGKRVLVTEIANEGATTSSLADALGASKISDQPTLISPNLKIASLTPTLGHQMFLRDVLPMKILADAAMRTGAVRR